MGFNSAFKVLTQFNSYILNVPKMSSKTADYFSTPSSRGTELRSIQPVFGLYS